MKLQNLERFLATAIFTAVAVFSSRAEIQKKQLYQNVQNIYMTQKDSNKINPPKYNPEKDKTKPKTLLYYPFREEFKLKPLK